MILTVTLNAALDKTYVIPGFRLDAVNRPGSTIVVAGGKGINVARVLHALDAPVLATGLLAGHTGSAIASRLEAEGIPHDFHRLAAGESRTCAAVVSPGSPHVTEINEDGPPVSALEYETFLAHYRRLLPRASTVVLSGSLPPGLGPEAYGPMIAAAREAGKRITLDTSGPALPAGMAAGPDWLKPNQHEAEDALGYAITPETLARAVTELLARGPAGVALTLGGAGAAVANREEAWFLTAPAVEVLNPVGSGDSFLAGLVAGADRGLPLAEAARLAVACGSANAAVAGAAACTASAIAELTPRVGIRPLAEASWGSPVDSTR